MAKRLLIGLGLVGAAVIGYLVLANRFRSDEDRVRLVVEDMVAAFNAREPGAILEHLHDDWRDETLDLDRGRLGLFLRGAFANRGGFGGASLRRRAALVGEIRVVVEGDAARADLVVVTRELEGASYVERWRGEFACDFLRVDGAWRLHRSRHETLSGRRPF